MGDARNGFFTQTKAWCVEKSNFVNIFAAMQDTSGPSVGQSGSSMSSDGIGSGDLLEAVLTSKDSGTSLNAQSMDIQAQRHIGGEMWQTLEGGFGNCSNCFSAALERVPMGTERILADIKLGPGLVEGLVYLASMT